MGTRGARNQQKQGWKKKMLPFWLILSLGGACSSGQPSLGNYQNPFAHQLIQNEYQQWTNERESIQAQAQERLKQKVSWLRSYEEQRPYYESFIQNDQEKITRLEANRNQALILNNRIVRDKSQYYQSFVDDSKKRDMRVQEAQAKKQAEVQKRIEARLQQQQTPLTPEKP